MRYFANMFRNILGSFPLAGPSETSHSIFSESLLDKTLV